MDARGAHQLMVVRLGIAGALTAVALVLLLPATAATVGTARAVPDCPGARTHFSKLTTEQVRSILICVANNERTIRGLPALNVDARLQAASQKYMEGSSINPNVGDRMEDEGYNWVEYARLGAAGHPTVFELIKAHLAIEQECFEALSPRYVDIGVGFSVDANGSPNWEQILALEDDPPGDNTGPQESCPQALLGSYGPAEAGPGGSESLSPRARIVNARPLTISGTRAKIRVAFRSARPMAGFKCRLDRKPFRSCRSPRKFWVGRGRHVFRVATVRRSGQLVLPPARAIIRFTNRRLSISTP